MPICTGTNSATRHRRPNRLPPDRNPGDPAGTIAPFPRPDAAPPHLSADMSVDDPTSHASTRRDRLAARRRRYRWASVLVAAVILGAAGTVAAFAYTENSEPASGPE